MLSAQRTGAIVAIERQIGLRNYIEGGIPLDAVLTYDLLLSIFQLASPLHDGAVIVQNDRVAAAACFLPLTINPRLSKELGSRHRAAIGLTEENDAVAIVVSKKRASSRSSSTVRSSAAWMPTRCGQGCVRSCSSGARRRPRERFSTPDGDANMSIWPFRHIGMKLLSLGLALLLWMAVAGEQTVERVLRVPLELQQFPASLELVGDFTTAVDVRVRGSAGALSRVTAGDVVAVLDLRGAEPGPGSFA
jgi:hypothetical protein